MDSPIVSIKTDPPPGFAEFLEARALDRVQHRDLPFSNVQPISISYHSSPPATETSRPGAAQHDQILGGLTGYLFGAYLQISLLWVSETLRGRGVGRALMERAEYEAAQRGCTYVAVDTFGFQAEDFYVRKLGFHVLVRVPGAFERRSTKIYMRKRVQKTLGPPYGVLDANIHFRASKDLALAEIIRKGLDSHRQTVDPSLLFNYNPLHLAPGDHGINLNDVKFGLSGHSGGSFLIIECLWVHASLQTEHIARPLLEAAEAQASARCCSGVITFVFDFDTVWKAILEEHGYISMAAHSGWFDGIVDRYLMFKELLEEE